MDKIRTWVSELLKPDLMLLWAAVPPVTVNKKYFVYLFAYKKPEIVFVHVCTKIHKPKEEHLLLYIKAEKLRFKMLCA